MKFFGVKINMAFILMLLIFFVFGYFEEIILSFIAVFVHELFHTMTALLLGYSIESIEIFPFGGVTKLKETLALEPRDEILVAISGPLINLIIVFIGVNYKIIINEFFIYSNLGIGIFNLIPILPLDGGRVIRAYLSLNYGIKKGTKIISIISKCIIIIMATFGLSMIKEDYSNIFVLLLSIFLYMAVNKEINMSRYMFIKEFAHKKRSIRNKKILTVKNIIAKKDVSLKEIIDSFLVGKYHMIMVVDEEYNVVGNLTENEILDGAIKYGINVSLEKLLRYG
ncbi:MAG: M50 family metallopeptidase [Anaeromicrobium sp.]|jgi:stage IV sporulation protein FB|uniref:M50 family metallopeptidase n=1 Tax=Anaeromicrobium sp. TaxID=1929132 RepID=UPI0025D1E36B|nr:M50 family metallopeptidase [Anaeromicrobium sp.]MCT4594955.1 M50 family metallopeptidase [Anaeromicrobium sp.]